MSCVVCRRDHRGFGFADPIPSPFPKHVYRSCSMGHLDVIMAYWKANETMNLTKHEKAAMLVASDKAGEYLEGIGKTDLAAMTQSEWQAFIELIFTASTQEIGRLSDQDAPF